MTKKTTDLPDFESPEWNRKREELEEAVITAATALLEHTKAGGVMLPIKHGIRINITRVRTGAH